MRNDIVCSVVLLFSCAATSFGQISRATILGTVTDPQGSLIQGAPVKMIHLETNQVYALSLIHI